MGCNTNIHELNIFYMRETNQFFLCSSENGNTIHIISMDENFNIITNYSFPNCDFNHNCDVNIYNIYSFSIIFSYELLNYYLIIAANGNDGFFNFTSTTINYNKDRINNITTYIEENQNDISDIIINILTTYISTKTQIFPHNVIFEHIL